MLEGLKSIKGMLLAAFVMVSIVIMYFVSDGEQPKAFLAPEPIHTETIDTVLTTDSI